MSTTYAAIPEDGLEVTSEIKEVGREFYQPIFTVLDHITKLNAEEDADYREVRYVIANYIFLIHERLQRNMVREIDYSQVKAWAKKNHKLATFLLSKQEGFPMEAFEKWISPAIDLMPCAMYDRSNRFTKNYYH